MIKLVDIAKAAGVSTTKVSRALSGSPGVSRAEIDRITALAAGMGWTRTNPFARGIRTGRSHMLGCLLNDVTNPYYSELMVGIEHTALDKGYMVLFCDASRSHTLMERLLEYQVDGLILTSHNLSEAGRINAYIEMGKPVITSAEDTLPYTVTGRVLADYHSAAALLVNRLIGFGHSRIAFFGDGYENSRFNGYVEGLERNGLAFDAALAPFSTVHGADLDGGRKTALQLLAMMELPDPPTAAVVHNDLKAVGMILELRERGYGIPGDLSICSFDGLEPCGWMTPPLTTIATNNELWGRLLAESVISAVEGTPPRNLLVPWNLIEGGTVGPVA